MVAYLIGGLGNQLFQYACAWSLAKRERRELLLDAGGFDQYKLRPFLLDRLKVKAPCARPDELAAWGLKAGPLGRLRRWAFGTRIAALHERGLPWQPLKGPVGEDLWLHGYWQSERYFAADAAALRPQFALNKPATGANAVLLKRILSAGSKACSLHVRRGDYVSSPMAAYVHGSVGLPYYKAAVERLKKKVNGLKLFVFSDDPAWGKEHLPFAKEAVFVEANPPTAPEEDLRLMAACRHFVLANSSFSWWGAWLGERKGSQVIAPARWFKDPKKDARDLLPARWQRL